ncbi:flagellar hook-basal body complex protein FliE [Spongorhabdus nitratireducens]
MIDQFGLNTQILSGSSLSSAMPKIAGREDELQAQGGQSTSFGDVLRSAVEKVNELQQDATTKQTAYETGESIDLIETMVSGQKASIAFQGLVQVRNRVVSAYETVYNMPV